MPLDAREAVGIINTFQNMRLSREQAARSTESFGKGMLEHEADAQPGEEQLSPGLRQRMTETMGVPEDVANTPLGKTSTAQKQRAGGVADIESYFEQLDAYDAAIRQAEVEGIKNPEMKSIAEAMNKGRGLFEQGQRRMLEKKRQLTPRSQPPGAVEDAITKGKSRIPYSGR